MAKRILIVDDDPDAREILHDKLVHSGYDITAVADAEAALQRVGALRPDLVVSDIRLPGMDGLTLLRRLRENLEDVDVLMITAHEDMTTAIEAMKAGAFEYVVKPVDLRKLDSLVERCFRDQELRRKAQAGDVWREEGVPGGLVGRSSHMIDIFKMIGVLAGNRTTVFIRGETGTGKERIARAIHENSAHGHEPFLPVNCTALTATLLESELFGHVKGAFTGAIASRKGYFEQAGAGTIFLDEIGDTSPEFQSKLLRVLEEREFFPVGGESRRRTEARILAATHRPIEAYVEDGRFREDLYYRLKVIEIDLPPLRQRPEDIPFFCDHILSGLAVELHKEKLHLSDDALGALMAYDWPGNVRELQNTLTRAAVLARGPVITPEHLTLKIGGDPLIAPMPADDTLEAAIAAHVQHILYRAEGNKSEASRILEISRSRLDRIIDKHRLVVPV